MADTLVSPVVVASSPIPAKAEATHKVANAKNLKAKPSHPSTAGMVNAAIKTLAERNGSSLQAIKKYMAGTYKLDTEKHALFIKKYLKSAVTAGALVQTKGKGASGSFKLPVKKTEAATAKPKPKISAKKEDSPKKVVKKLVEKKDSATAKLKKEAPPKTAAAKKLVAGKKAAQPKASTSKSPKAKKASKLPTSKPKAPKPKKAAAPKAKAAAKKPVAAKK